MSLLISGCETFGFTQYEHKSQILIPGYPRLVKRSAKEISGNFSRLPYL